MSDPTQPDKPTVPQAFPQLAQSGDTFKLQPSAEPKAPIEQLMEEARVRGASRMIIEGTKAQDVTDVQIKAVVANVTAFRKKHASLSIFKIARATNYSTSVISQTLSGKYAGDVRQVVLDLDRWLEAELKRESAPRTSDFVLTSVAREIFTVAEQAITTRRIGLVYGGKTSGVGKTLALRAIAAECAGSIMITARKTSASMRGVLDSIADEMKLPKTGSNDVRFMRIADKLRDTPRLLIVDQIHNLCGASRDLPLFCLCDLLDETRAPQLWAGTSDIRAYLDRGQTKGDPVTSESLAQIHTRIVLSRDLMERTNPKETGGRGEPLFSIDEVRKIFAKNKIRLSVDATDYLCKLANLPDSGALRLCVDLVDITTSVKSKEDVKLITAEMLHHFHRGLRNWRSYEILQAKLTDEQRGPRAVAKTA